METEIVQSVLILLACDSKLALRLFYLLSNMILFDLQGIVQQTKTE